MDQPNVASALYWLSWIEPAKTWAEAGVVIALAIGLLATIVGKPFQKTVDAARESEVAHLTAQASASMAVAADAQNRAASARREVSAANERIAQLQKEAAEAGKLAEQERLKRVQLEAKIAPRQITGEQQKELAEVLKSFTGQVGTIQASPATAESEMFVSWLSPPLTDAGWKITILRGTVGPTVLFPRGIIVWYRPVFRNGALLLQDQEEAARAANAFVGKLKEFGLEATAMPGVQMDPANTIQIIVGEK